MTNEQLKPLFNLARYDVFRLFGIFVIAWTVINLGFYIVERLFWGEGFIHWGDLMLVAALGVAFGYTACRMGEDMVVRIMAAKRDDQ